MGKLADLFFREERTPREDDELRVLLDSVDSVAGFMAQAVGPTGDIQRLRAGNVVLDTAGIRTVDKTIQIDRGGITIFPGTTLQDLNTIHWRLHDDPGRNYLNLGVIIGGTTPNRLAHGGLVVQNEDGGTGSGQLDLQAVGGSSSVTSSVILKNTGTGVDINSTGADLDTVIQGDTVTDVLKVDAGLDQMLAGTTIAIKERAASQADITTYGQLWVKNDDPNILRYTDGDGTEFIVDMTAV